jgi:hypothetical protein
MWEVSGYAEVSAEVCAEVMQRFQQVMYESRVVPHSSLNLLRRKRMQ